MTFEQWCSQDRVGDNAVFGDLNLPLIGIVVGLVLVTGLFILL